MDNTNTPKTFKKAFWVIMLVMLGVVSHGVNLVELRWDSDEPPEQTLFEVWRSSSPQGPWELWVITPATRVLVPATGPSGFFKVRATNTVSHLVSGWATGIR